ncbi:hypothetical protein V8G54_020749 [Vigna mungo]|uniref:Uncharacterized protein n=1 Tax=Vigna mungo TaxID=3915 RepID=A0AAQ3NG41_VIGMU
MVSLVQHCLWSLSLVHSWSSWSLGKVRLCRRCGRQHSIFVVVVALVIVSLVAIIVIAYNRIALSTTLTFFRVFKIFLYFEFSLQNFLYFEYSLIIFSVYEVCCLCDESPRGTIIKTVLPFLTSIYSACAL